MALLITERHVRDATILDLVGTLTLGDGADRLKDVVASLILRNRNLVVLNLREISYIDSSGLGRLVACHRSLATAMGGLRLLHVSERQRYLLSITRLLSVFQTFESEEEAVRV